MLGAGIIIGHSTSVREYSNLSRTNTDTFLANADIAR